MSAAEFVGPGQLPPASAGSATSSSATSASTGPGSTSGVGHSVAPTNSRSSVGGGPTEVLGVVRSMIYAREPVGPALVLAEFRRQGGPSKPVADRLLQATACGALALALRGYAAAVVAESLRRRIESAGAALSAAAETMAEADLAPLAERAAAAVADCAGRLARLRGDG